MHVHVHVQVDYRELWARVVSAFREVCDALPNVRVSLEFKPTDENTRFFAVPSTGAALLLAKEVDRAMHMHMTHAHATYHMCT